MAETIEVDAESHTRGMVLLGEFSAIVDHANTELAMALKDYREAANYEKRGAALQFILRLLTKVGHEAGIHGEYLTPISDLVIALREMPHEARNALGLKMWGELHPSAILADDADTHKDNKTGQESDGDKGGGQERPALRYEFMCRQAACHDYWTANGFAKSAARKRIAEICAHSSPKIVADNYLKITGPEAKKFRPIYEASLATLNRMPGSPKENGERFLMATVLETPPNIVNRPLAEDAERNEKSSALKDARAERAKEAKRKKRAAAKAEPLRFPSTKCSIPPT